MSLNNYIGGKQQQYRPFSALGISVAGHVAAFTVLMHAPAVTLKLPEPAKSEYKQAFEGKEQKLVWYRFNKELPNVTPPRSRPDPKPVRAETRARQQIVATPKNAPKRPRFVWTPAPELKAVQPLDSPNLLAIRIPPPAPPKPQPKAFIAPPDIQKPPAAKVELLPDAPQLEAKALAATALPVPPKISRRFTPPPQRVPSKIAEVAPAPEAPQLAASPNPALAALKYNFKAPSRPFTAPSATSPAPAKQIELPPNPEILVANSRDLNLAIVGLNPVDKPLPPAPAPSPAQLSAGPEVRKNGGEPAGDGKGLTVPDLFVRGAREAKPDLIAQAYAAPTSALTLRAASNSGKAGTAQPAPDSASDLPAVSHSGAMKVAGAPDRRFDGRDVYMMAIQMPNLTSYSGSWLMWYADRTAKEAGLAPVAPPVPYRKVDPKYIAAAQSDRIEGKVQLACVIGKDGRVSTIELVRGLDDRLNQSAREALGKWQFAPATRHGEPVEVDVLVEIPFRLEPARHVTF